MCLVVDLIDLTKKMSKLLNLEIFIELVCIDHLIKAISQQSLTGLVCNYTRVFTMTWRCISFWICWIQFKNCQNYTFKLILIWLAFFTISSRLYLQVWSVAVLFDLRKSRKTKHKIFEFFIELVVFHHLVMAISHNQLVLLIWHFTQTLTINHTLMMYCVDSPKKCQNHRCFKTFVSLILLNYNYKEVILTTAIRISLCLPFVSCHINFIDG